MYTIKMHTFQITVLAQFFTVKTKFSHAQQAKQIHHYKKTQELY